MHRTVVSGIVGIVVMLAACTASPPTPTTSSPDPASQPVTSTPDPVTVRSSDTDDPHPEVGPGIPAAEATIGSAETKASGGADESGATDEMVDTAPEPLPGADGTPSIAKTQADLTPASEQGADPSSTQREMDELVDDVDDLLIDLEAILGDLDADLADLADGLNMNEGDI